MIQTPDEFDLFDEVEGSVIQSSLPGPSTIENFSSQLISRLGINSHHVQRQPILLTILCNVVITLMTHVHLIQQFRCG